MTDTTVRGRFVWHELATSDASAAHTFYEKALGWKTQPFEHDPTYFMFAAPSGPLGGSVALSDGESSGWIPYIGTTDIEATVAEAVRLGATAKKEVTTIANGGSYAVLTDPQGADFGLYASPDEPGEEEEPKRGEFSWHELATSDGRAAVEFYSALFGWELVAEHDMGPMGMYSMFGREAGAAPLGGIYNKSPEQPGSAWLGYVRVKDLDRTVKKVKSGGGTLVNGPMEVPGGDWIAQFLDPQGAPFAVHLLAADRQAALAKEAAKKAAEEAREEPAEVAAEVEQQYETEPEAVEAEIEADAETEAEDDAEADMDADMDEDSDSDSEFDDSAEEVAVDFEVEAVAPKRRKPARRSSGSKKAAKKAPRRAAAKAKSKAGPKAKVKAKAKPAKAKRAAAKHSKRPARKVAKAAKGGKKKAVKVSKKKAVRAKAGKAKKKAARKAK